ncbi:MAG TPA: nitrite reductase large subunit NirB [Acidimicrobiales bacterium]
MRTVVVAGYGMVGHRFLQAMADRGQLGADGPWRAVVVGEEPYAAYDRVALSSYVEGLGADDLSLVDPGFHDTPGLVVHLGDRVTAADTAARTVTTAQGRVLAYDALVLATGSVPFVPPIPGTDAPGAFVYRTIDDLEAIRVWAAGCRTGVVVGGGLLGLEAANALRLLGLQATVVEFAPRLMPVQLDEGAAAILQERIEALGIGVHTGCAATAVRTEGGQVVGLDIDGWDAPLPADLVVFAAGIRPRDDLARAAGLAVGERGGVVVDDTLATSAPGVYAIGECALHRGRIYGLVAPGYRMAETVAARLAGDEGEDATFTGADTSTKLKLLGVDVASVGDCHGTATDGSRSLVFTDPLAGEYRKVVVSADGRRVVGGILVGDLQAYPLLVQYARGTLDPPERLDALIAPAAGGAGGGAATGVAALPDAAVVCSCNNVDAGALRAAIRDGNDDVGALKGCTRAGTTCGSCLPLLADLLDDEARKAGKEVRRTLCEHFDLTRQELFDIVRVRRIRSFATLVAEHGRGRGCEICKPAVASMFASLASGYILDGEQAALQDTNDHFLANLQRDGTYSVVPRVPGGEITPDKLIVLGEVAREFDLYTKITGGQRIDLFGARVDQLPAIWARLVDAGFESGHAYGKAVRTVKSCVGTTWCRYGVQDAVGLAIRLELRYRGLRAPHKIKAAVSGCARECAEAQGKDVGVIATERGWNLYVAGNGGMTPRHAVLLSGDLDTETLIRQIDAFLMYYIRTADRLERTATWFEKLDGGIEHLRRVIVDDALGLVDELVADMERHVASYECEWKATLDDPARLARFTTFVNADEPDPSLVYVRERGQRRPALPHEKALS